MPQPIMTVIAILFIRAKECRCSNRLITVYPKYLEHTSISVITKEGVGALDCRPILTESCANKKLATLIYELIK